METVGSTPGFAARRRRTVDYVRSHPGLAAAHYYRPIVPGWNDTDEQIAEALAFGEPLGLTVVGGLKETPNLLDMTARRGLIPPIVGGDAGREKHFPPELVDRIFAIHRSLGLTSTIVGDQSCGLAVMLSRLGGTAVPNVEAVRMYDDATGRRPKCMGRCPADQLAACVRPPRPDHATVRALVDRLGVGPSFRITDSGVYLRPRRRPTPQEVDFLAAHLRFAVFVEQGEEQDAWC
jgi:hypothetical protein